MSYVRKVPAQHHCEPPPVFGTHDDYEDWADQPGEWPVPRVRPGVRLPRVGDVWECDECGRWWQLRPSPYVNVLAPSWERKWRPWWRRRR